MQTKLEDLKSKYEDKTFKNRVSLFPSYDDFMVIKDNKDKYILTTCPQTRKMRDVLLKEQFCKNYGVYED